MAKGGNPHHRRLNFNRMVPNALTLLALCAGMTSIRMALTERWEMAVGAVIVAMILDGLDGRIARLMKANSEFGAQLDSLSDVINFGVAPALIVYHWSLIEVRGLGWAIALLLTICCALRLARFNANLSIANKPPWASRFFTGVPAPAGAGLALLPMILSFEFGEELLQSPIVNLVVVAGATFLYISDTTVTVNLRTGNSFGNKIVALLRPGTKVTLIQEESGWAEVALEDGRGPLDGSVDRVRASGDPRRRRRQPLRREYPAILPGLQTHRTAPGRYCRERRGRKKQPR